MAVEDRTTMTVIRREIQALRLSDDELLIARASGSTVTMMVCPRKGGAQEARTVATATIGLLPVPVSWCTPRFCRPFVRPRCAPA